MKNTKILFIVTLLIAFTATCKKAEDIIAREKLKKSSHQKPIVKVITPSNLGTIKTINTSEFNQLLVEKNGTLIDVRTPEEFTEGHIKNAVNINFKKRTFPNYIHAIDKNKAAFIYCRSGNRSEKAALIMQSLGFKEVYNLAHGFKTWKAEKKEISSVNNKENQKLQHKLSTKTFVGKSIVGKPHQINANELEQLINNKKVTLVDIRTAKEFVKGHIDGAVNVDWKNNHFEKHIKHVTDEKPIAIYCQSGNRGTRAMYAMNAIGFKEVYNLNDGMKEWLANSKPVKTLEVKGDKHHLDVENFNNAIVGQVGTLVDIRTPKEFTDMHIPHAKNIDFKNANFKTEFAKLDKKTPVMIYCRSGGRSGRATKVLSEMGFKVYNLDKGINQWKSKHMKVKGKNVHAKDGGEEGC